MQVDFLWTLGGDGAKRVAPTLTVQPVTGKGKAPAPVNLNNVVVGILWRCDATAPGPIIAGRTIQGENGEPDKVIPDEVTTYSAFNSGEIKLAPPAPKDFKVLEKVTPEDLAEWAADAGLDVDAIQADLAAQIEKQAGNAAPETVLI